MADTEIKETANKPTNRKPYENRQRDYKKKDTSDNPLVDENSPIIQAFRQYQTHLDSRYEKYERIVKKSRDVTADSKKVIFLLHRITGESNKESIINEAKQKLKLIRETHLLDTAMELEGEDLFQFLRAFSPGLQEYVEAVTYLSYLETGSIATLEDIANDLEIPIKQLEKVEGATEEENSDSELVKTTVRMPLPPLEYMLGLADLSGELMRKAINSVGQRDFEEPLKVSVVLRQLYDGFYSIGNLAGRDMFRKTIVLKQSLQKVENACYNLTVRKSEIPQNLDIPKHMLDNVFSSQLGSGEGQDEF